MGYRLNSSVEEINYLPKEKYLGAKNIQLYRSRAIFAVLLIAVLATSTARSYLEQYMTSHTLILLPLLVLCGMWIGSYFAEKKQLLLPYHFALPLLLIALFVSMFWMLPRNLDASLENDGYLVAKYLTLPFFLGVPLALAWRKIGPITKAFFIANAISMVMVLAWLYVEAPVRLCNYYLINEQKQLGMYLIYIAGIISVYWVTRLFIGNIQLNVHIKTTNQ